MRQRLAIWILAVAGVLWGVAGWAETVERVVEAQGTGATREAAVESALVEALKQVKGVSLEAQQECERAIRTTVRRSDGVRDVDQTNLEQESSRRVSAATKGFVRGYRVLSAEERLEGEWTAEVEVRLGEYKDPGFDPDSRRKVAVYPFRRLQSEYQVGLEQMGGEVVAADLKAKLEEHLTQSRRFAVLSRGHDEALQEELALLGGTEMRPEEQAKWGAALGADYLVTGDLSVLEVVDDGGSAGGRWFPRLVGAGCSLNYEVTLLATRQVKWKGSRRVKWGPADMAYFGGDARVVYEELLEAVTKSVAAEILANIYPLSIVGVNGDEVVLGQGGVGIETGTVYGVYRQGEMMVDPYTGEQLGAMETLVAKVRVMRVEAKVSYARVEEGHVEPEDIGRGAVCRPLYMEVLPVNVVPAGAAAGGVRLPWD